MDFLSGKKTYIVVATSLVLIALEVGLKIDIPGYTPGADWVGDVLTLLGIGALRDGIDKIT